MIEMDEIFNKVSSLNEKEFKIEIIRFIKYFFCINIKNRGYEIDTLSTFLKDAYNVSNKFSIYDQRNIAGVFLLIVAIGPNFYNQKKYILLEAALNNMWNTSEEERLQNCFDILAKRDFVDLQKEEAKEFYNLLKIPIWE